MKIEEAFSLLHPDTSRDAVMRIKEHGGDGLKAIEEACVVACEAMEKQISVKPISSHYEDDGINLYVTYTCPNHCNIGPHLVSEEHISCEHRYCPKCGQKLDWSKE